MERKEPHQIRIRATEKEKLAAEEEGEARGEERRRVEEGDKAKRSGIDKCRVSMK